MNSSQYPVNFEIVNNLRLGPPDRGPRSMTEATASGGGAAGGGCGVRPHAQGGARGVGCRRTDRALAGDSCIRTPRGAAVGVRAACERPC
eukprot:COSAG02_NODE_37_length_48203_cov_57.745708_11_plen_90_part_00